MSNLKFLSWFAKRLRGLCGRRRFADGSSIRFVVREWCEYREPDGRRMRVQICYGAKKGDSVLKRDGVCRWLPPHDREAVPLEKQEEVIGKFVEYFGALGEPCRVDSASSGRLDNTVGDSGMEPEGERISCLRADSYSVRFQVAATTDQISNAVLVYRADEYSFDVEPLPCGGFTSALINDVSLELDRDGRVISIWGLCPYSRWKIADLSPPHAEFGNVFAVSDTPLRPGVSVRVNESGYWPVLVDPSSGWVRMGSEVKAEREAASNSSVKIIPGVIVEITRDGEFFALWLKPEKLPNLR